MIKSYLKTVIKSVRSWFSRTNRTGKSGKSMKQPEKRRNRRTGELLKFLSDNYEFRYNCLNKTTFEENQNGF